MEFINIALREALVLSKKDDYILLDVREPYRYQQKHLQGAINCPYGILKDQNFHNKKLIVYCDFGGQSMLAARHLAKEGYAVYNIVGGVFYSLNKSTYS